MTAEERTMEIDAYFLRVQKEKEKEEEEERIIEETNFFLRMEEESYRRE